MGDDKDDVPEEMTLEKKITLKEPLGIFHNLHSSKDKMVEATPNFWQFIKHRKDTCSVSLDMLNGKKGKTVQVTNVVSSAKK